MPNCAVVVRSHMWTRRQLASIARSSSTAPLTRSSSSSSISTTTRSNRLLSSSGTQPHCFSTRVSASPRSMAFFQWTESINNNSCHIVKRSMVVVTKTKTTTTTNTSETEHPKQNNTLGNNNNNSTELPPNNHNHKDLNITDACWKRIHKLSSSSNTQEDSDNQNNNITSYLRLYVDAGGCSGFEYKFELDTDDNLEMDEDIVYHGPHQTRLVIDKASLDLLKGSTIDYVQEMIKSSFEVRDNPQSESACGCGSSFALKNFSSNPALD